MRKQKSLDSSLESTSQATVFKISIASCLAAHKSGGRAELYKNPSKWELSCPWFSTLRYRRHSFFIFIQILYRFFEFLINHNPIREKTFLCFSRPYRSRIQWLFFFKIWWRNTVDPIRGKQNASFSIRLYSLLLNDLQYLLSQFFCINQFLSMYIIRYVLETIRSQLTKFIV